MAGKAKAVESGTDLRNQVAALGVELGLEASIELEAAEFPEQSVESMWYSGIQERGRAWVSNANISELRAALRTRLQASLRISESGPFVESWFFREPDFRQI
ncbi:MAG: hypothetical protein M3461_11695 [Pseudomonadota bacterium]|nr:hypothetical protein [Pseudomonadota bacterium]